MVDNLCHSEQKSQEIENNLFLSKKSPILVAMVTGSCEVRSFAAAAFWKA